MQSSTFLKGLNNSNQLRIRQNTISLNWKKNLTIIIPVVQKSNQAFTLVYPPVFLIKHILLALVHLPTWHQSRKKERGSTTI